MPDELASVLAFADAHLDNGLARLFELIRIPSVSTEAAHADDCSRAAAWLENELADVGFKASIQQTPGHPMVVGHAGPAGSPHVLFYGHYDVQPADPLAAWETPPFEPTLRASPNGDMRIVARGASDDKGQLMTFLEACRAWRTVTGGLPISVSVLFEGEEEMGSGNMPAFLHAHAAELRADVALICDTNMWDAKTPAIVTMLRGMVGEEVEVTGANADLHSGMFGGAARNPLQLLSEIIASLRTPHGSVAIAGFYDGVEELPREILAQWERFDEAGFLADKGLKIPAGERDRSVLEQVWARPSCDVNGFTGGYTGQGLKTVIPEKASAKISFRLVAGQDPERVRELFRDHVRRQIPADCSARFTSHGATPAVRVPFDGWFAARARAALMAEWGAETAIAATGGSNPVVAALRQHLGLDSLLIGFARFDNRIHAPNEKYDLSSFTHGIRSWIRILAAFSERG